MGIGGHASHDYNVCTHAHKHAFMLIYMHPIFLHAWAHILAKSGHIEIVKLGLSCPNSKLELNMLIPRHSYNEQ